MMMMMMMMLLLQQQEHWLKWVGELMALQGTRALLVPDNVVVVVVVVVVVAAAAGAVAQIQQSFKPCCEGT